MSRTLATLYDEHPFFPRTRMCVPAAGFEPRSGGFFLVTTKPLDVRSTPALHENNNTYPLVHMLIHIQEHIFKETCFSDKKMYGVVDRDF